MRRWIVGEWVDPGKSASEIGDLFQSPIDRPYFDPTSGMARAMAVVLECGLVRLNGHHASTLENESNVLLQLRMQGSRHRPHWAKPVNGACAQR